MRFVNKLTTMVAVIAMIASVPAFATTEWNKTIQAVGTVQDGGASFVIFNEALSVSCQGGLVSLADPSTNGGKAMLAALLSAQAAGKGVQRIDYSQVASGACAASMIVVGP
ncbi:hypothetical protein [Dyella silvatica]|uniref:hypothetical protein n=1 Tax=Dyella silvatica TaxID=2992128 RepID=UPI002256859C|nr:hypothetical protein [Dyella silvatica]